MPISIRTPQAPQGVDYSGLFGGLDQLGQNIQGRRAFDAYNEWLQGIAPQAAPQQPALSNLAPTNQAQPMDYASQRVSQAHAASGGNPPQGAIASYIRHAAQKRGIDPETAIKVAMSEGGLEDPVRQSDVVKNGVREQSYGPFQLYMGGGLGNEFQQATGMHPGDEGAWQKAIDFALDKAKEKGWGAWYGAAKAGIGERDGIGVDQSATTAPAGAPMPQMAQAAPQATGGPMLPPPEVMKKLFRSEQTRPIAIQLAQTAKAARGGDPEAALKLRKLAAEVKNLENPQPDLPSAVQEYQFAVQQGFPGTFQDWEASKKGGMSLQVNPDGTISFQQGNMKPLTEGQSKDTVYATRATGALPLIDKFGDALTNLGENVGGNAPVVGNYMKSKEYQQAEQAGNEFLQAILRKDTGAAITKQEMEEYGTTYLPRPGDSKEVLAQKKVSRARALEALKAGMPAQAIVNMEKATANVNAQSPQGLPDGVTEDDIIETMRANGMTREEVMKRLMGGQ